MEQEGVRAGVSSGQGARCELWLEVAMQGAQALQVRPVRPGQRRARGRQAPARRAQQCCIAQPEVAPAHGQSFLRAVLKC